MTGNIWQLVCSFSSSVYRLEIEEQPSTTASFFVCLDMMEYMNYFLWFKLFEQPGK